MKPLVLIDNTLFGLVINRLCHQLIENHDTFEGSVIIGLQPRGILLSVRITERLEQLGVGKIQHGVLDPTFYRDDFRQSDKPLIARPTEIPFTIEGKRVILVDDVLYTGRTIRAGLEGLMEYGRPQSVELLVLIDRRFTRELPIEPNYIGLSVDSYDDQKVRVTWKKEGQAQDQVLLINE